MENNPESTKYSDLIASSLPEVTSQYVKYQLEYTKELFIAREALTQDLQSEVNTFYQNQGRLSRLALCLRLKKLPPRIRAFKEELTERFST